MLTDNPISALDEFEQVMQSISEVCRKGYRDHRDEMNIELQKLHQDRLALRAFVGLASKGEKFRALTGTQSFMLYSCKEFVMRINLWCPASQNMSPEAVELQDKYFSHMLGHNHNYDFFTIGLLGPGYHSKFFAVDTDISGLEQGDLVPFTRSWGMDLGVGIPFFVERDKEFHTQYPAKSFSVSLNLIPYSGFSETGRQYTLSDCGTKIRRVLVAETQDEISEISQRMA